MNDCCHWFPGYRVVISKEGGRQMFVIFEKLRSFAQISIFIITLFLSSIVFSADSPVTVEAPLQSWKHEFGFEERLRYEYLQDFDYNESVKDNGSLFFQRLRLNEKLSWVGGDQNKILDIFVEGLDAQTGGHQIKATATQVDDFDLHQAYVQVHHLLGSPVELKVGRMELKYGKGRLIAQPSWSNRVRAFDAAVVHYEKDSWFGDVFYGQDVKYDDNNFNRSLDEEYIAGIYGGYQKDKKGILWEGYFLTQTVLTTSTPTKRFTVGSRLQGKAFDEIEWEVEVPYQFGEIGTKNIRAYAISATAAYPFSSVKMKPKVFMEYNQASGDQDPNDSVSNTFNPLYQTTHDPYGILDFFRWQNMREVAVGVKVSPLEKFTLTPQMNFFWLESKFDSWYNSSGTALRSKTSGERGHYIGQELSLRGFYEINKNVKLEMGYAHFFPGGYVRDSGADDGTDWFYTQIVIKK